MAATVGASRLRTVGWIVFALFVVASGIDGGSVGVTKMLVNDHAKEAARHAVKAVDRMPVTPATATVAYQTAAEVVAKGNDVQVLSNPPGTDYDFLLGPDRSVTLTVEKQAPTLLWQYLPVLRDFTQVRFTYHQEPIGY